MHFQEPILASASLSTAVESEWAVAELLQNRDAMNKLQDEIASVVGTNRHIAEAAPLSPSCSVNETLRLHPPVPAANVIFHGPRWGQGRCCRGIAIDDSLALQWVFGSFVSNIATVVWGGNRDNR